MSRTSRGTGGGGGNVAAGGLVWLEDTPSEKALDKVERPKWEPGLVLQAPLVENKELLEVFVKENEVALCFRTSWMGRDREGQCDGGRNVSF